MIQQTDSHKLDDKQSLNTSISDETKSRLEEDRTRKDQNTNDLFSQNEKDGLFEQQINTLINYISLSIQDMETNSENIQRNFSVFDQSNFKIKKEIKYEIEDHINGNIGQQKGLHSLFQDAYQQDIGQSNEQNQNGKQDKQQNDQIDKMIMMSQQMAESIEYEQNMELDKMVNLGMTGSIMKMLTEQSQKNKEEEEKLKDIKKNIFKANRFYHQLITSLLLQIDNKNNNGNNKNQQIEDHKQLDKMNQQIQDYEQEVQQLKEKTEMKDEQINQIMKENEYLEMKLNEQKDKTESEIQLDIQLDERQSDIDQLKKEMETKDIQLQ